VAQANKQQALVHTTDFVGLKSCEVSTTMTAENWKGAKNAIQRSLHIAPEDAQTEENALQGLKRSLVDMKRVAAELCLKRCQVALFSLSLRPRPIPPPTPACFDPCR
jgi:hypothetical protein